VGNRVGKIGAMVVHEGQKTGGRCRPPPGFRASRISRVPSLFRGGFSEIPSATKLDRPGAFFGLRPKNGRAIPVIGTSRQLLQRDILVAIGCIADIGRHLRGMHRSRLTHFDHFATARGAVRSARELSARESELFDVPLLQPSNRAVH